VKHGLIDIKTPQKPFCELHFLSGIKPRYLPEIETESWSGLVPYGSYLKDRGWISHRIVLFNRADLARFASWLAWLCDRTSAAHNKNNNDYGALYGIQSKPFEIDRNGRRSTDWN
jgi:hypothetical protein